MAFKLFRRNQKAKPAAPEEPPTAHFCTLFDSFYLSRGLAMYGSLAAHCRNFHLYIFAFDDQAYEILTAMSLPRVTVVSLADFETPELLAVKPGRSKGEYCWTCTSSVIEHCLERYRLPQCTYLDADLYFFADPLPLLEEMGEDSVLITEHRYAPRYDHSKKCGRYCVQFISFRNDTAGREVLTWWRDRCLEWCYDRFEDGRFGDQKYLDDWTTRFHGVHVLEHLGGGLAPWNVQRYSLTLDSAGYRVSGGPEGRSDALVFYHFHAVKFLDDGTVDLSAYDLRRPHVAELYDIYLGTIETLHGRLTERFGFVPRLQAYLPKRPWLAPAHRLGRRLLGVYNVIHRT